MTMTTSDAQAGLDADAGSEKNRYQAPNQILFKANIKRNIEFIEASINEIEVQLAANIRRDEFYASKAKELLTIPGIGIKTVYSILALLPELGTLNGKQIASLCGLAPHPKQSGKNKGYRATIGGRRELRSALFMAAMAAARSKSRLGE